MEGTRAVVALLFSLLVGAAGVERMLVVVVEILGCCPSLLGVVKLLYAGYFGEFKSVQNYWRVCIIRENNILHTKAISHAIGT